MAKYALYVIYFNVQAIIEFLCGCLLLLAIYKNKNLKRYPYNYTEPQAGANNSHAKL